MPTLKRCFVAVVLLGVVSAGAILILGSLPPPEQREITVDVPQDRFSNGSGASTGSVRTGPLGRERSDQLANAPEALKLGR
jgi:hypothetical protein